MIDSTFCCFDGVSESAELRLWQSGVLTWDQFLDCPFSPFSIKKHNKIIDRIYEAKIALQAGLYDYFIQRLPPMHRIRILKNIYDRTGFIDIETTGLSLSDKITTIALRLNAGTSSYTRGVDISNFLSKLPLCDLLITFNGSRFDLPRLRKQFKLDIVNAHIDMLPVMKAFGFKGGQKAIECQLGFKRTHTDGVTGEDAVKLWQNYKETGDCQNLAKLQLYNKEDVAALEKISIWAYNQSMSAFPIPITLKKMKKN